MNRRETIIEEAKILLVHYFKLALTNQRFSDEMQSEMESIVDKIVEAVQ